MTNAAQVDSIAAVPTSSRNGVPATIRTPVDHHRDGDRRAQSRARRQPARRDQRERRRPGSAAPRTCAGRACARPAPRRQKSAIGELGELRGLHRQRADGDPAAGAQQMRTPMPGTSTASSSASVNSSIRTGPGAASGGTDTRAAPAMQAIAEHRVHRPRRISAASGVLAVDDCDAAGRAVDHDQAEGDQAERQQQQQVVLDRERVSAVALALFPLRPRPREARAGRRAAG